MNIQHQYLEVLSPEEVSDIHLTALRILEEIGLWLPDLETLKFLHEAGAHVIFEKQIVQFSAHLVESCIRNFPPRFTWHARNPVHTLDISGKETYFEAPNSTINVIDLHGQRRPGTETDGEKICRLCDALPNLHVMSTGVYPPELPANVLEAWYFKTLFTQSSKAIMGVTRSHKCSYMILRMAEVVADSCGLQNGGQLLLAATNPVSPLFNTPDQFAGWLVFVQNGVPLLISPEVQAGATGPATLAGALTQATAEFLGHATIAQLITPGIPVVYGCVSSIFDMRKTMLPYGAPEADLLNLGTAQLARYYGIPSRGTGSTSDANALGMQAGVDSLLSTLVCLMSGNSYVCHGAGELGNSLSTSYEKILIDDEIISMARRFLRGIEVSQKSLAFDVIKQVGPKGHFLGAEHTLHHFKSEQFIPTLMDRDKYDVWETSGSKRAEEKAHDRVQALLASHQPIPLPEDASRELEEIYSYTKRSAGLE